MAFDASKKGFCAAVLASLIWGGLAIYWRQLQAIPAYEILAYRMVSSFVVLLPVTVMCHSWKEIIPAFQNGRVLRRMVCSTLLIALNWFGYIWAVNNGRILETSLGYYMSPLCNVALGCLFLRERISRLQMAAFAVALLGVMYAVICYGAFPWLGLWLAISFALYGFIRKTVSIEALPGLFMETMLLAPVALSWILYQGLRGHGFLVSPSWREGLLLLGTGVVTALPLGLYAYGARRIRLITMGFIQFLSPSGSFLIGVFLYKEPLTPAALITFSAIWLALILQMVDSWRVFRAAEARRG